MAAIEWAHIPTIPYQRADGRRRDEIDSLTLYYELLALARLTGIPQRIVIEQFHAMPQQGVSSTLSFGRSTGQLEALLSLFGAVDRIRANVCKPGPGLPLEKTGAIRWAREWLSTYFP